MGGSQDLQIGMLACRGCFADGDTAGELVCENGGSGMAHRRAGLAEAENENAFIGIQGVVSPRDGQRGTASPHVAIHRRAGLDGVDRRSQNAANRLAMGRSTQRVG